MTAEFGDSRACPKDSVNQRLSCREGAFEPRAVECSYHSRVQERTAAQLQHNEELRQLRSRVASVQDAQEAAKVGANESVVSAPLEASFMYGGLLLSAAPLMHSSWDYSF